MAGAEVIMPGTVQLQVIARCQYGIGMRPEGVQEAPVFYPTEEVCPKFNS